MLDLEPIKKRERAATPGPWLFDAQGDWGLSTPMNMGGYSTTIVCGMLGEHEPVFEDTYPIGAVQDGDFMANAREDIPAMIAEIERLRAELDNLVSTGFAMEGLLRESMDLSARAKLLLDPDDDGGLESIAMDPRIQEKVIQILKDRGIYG
jgi:hypothetical protein